MLLFIISLFTGWIGAIIGSSFENTSLGGILGIILPFSIIIENIYRSLSKMPNYNNITNDELIRLKEYLKQYGICPSCGGKIVEGTQRCPICGLIIDNDSHEE